MNRLLSVLSLLFSWSFLFGQFSDTTLFQEARLETAYGISGSENLIQINGQEVIPFYYENPEETVVLTLQPTENASFDTSLHIIPSSDYEILEPPVFYRNGTYRIKLRFRNLNDPSFIRVLFQQDTDSTSFIADELSLYPYTKTRINFFLKDEDIFLGEDKIYELQEEMSRHFPKRNGSKSRRN